MYSCYYLYQIVQELQNLQSNFLYDFLIALIPTIPPSCISYFLYKENRRLQKELHASKQSENLRQEFLRFHEQIQATYWVLEKLFSNIIEITSSGELTSIKIELVNHTNDLIKIAGRYTLLTKNEEVQEKTTLIGRNIQSLCFAIDIFLDSEDMFIVKKHKLSRESLATHLEMDLLNKESSISELASKSMRTLGKFCEYKTSMESIGKESLS